MLVWVFVTNCHQWDTAGQERFRTITANYFRGAAGVIVVYDIGDKNSFDSVPRWLADVDKFSTDPQQVVRLIVGNKADMEATRQVPVRTLCPCSHCLPVWCLLSLFLSACFLLWWGVQKDIAEKWAASQGFEFFETSAKNSANVETAFVWLVKEITKKRGLVRTFGLGGGDWP